MGPFSAAFVLHTPQHRLPGSLGELAICLALSSGNGAFRKFSAPLFMLTNLLDIPCGSAPLAMFGAA